VRYAGNIRIARKKNGMNVALNVWNLINVKRGMMKSIRDISVNHF
jgi:hypothetical protein